MLLIGTILALIWYLLSFYYIEHRDVPIHLVSIPLDNRIPFIPVFVIFYYSWFIYCAVPMLLFLFFDEDDYLKSFAFLAIGMASFIIINYFYSTGLDIRPASVPGTDIFSAMVRKIYSVDTPTNVLPSIHVYNSVGIHICLLHSNLLKKVLARFSADQKDYEKKFRITSTVSGIWAILIIFSTLFIKQHSVIDLLAGLLFALVVYYFMYMRKQTY